MPRKKTILAVSENSQNPPENVVCDVKENPPVESDDDNDVPIQVSKIPEVKQKVDGRVKKPQTEAQKAATAKMKAALAAKWEKTRAEKVAMEQQRKKEVEEKVIKKALSIKKKQIKQQIALDEISDDDEPIEEIIPKIRKTIVRAPPQPTGPRIIFM